MEKDVLRPYGNLDVLYYYSKVSSKLHDFLKNKDIATKNWIPNGFMPYLIKRGSKLEPLWADDFKEVDDKFLKTRAEIESLKDARNKITKIQAKLWDYFLPRKLSDFFYAANSENPGKPIERIFYDMDRGKNTSPEQAQKIAKVFIETIKSDNTFSRLIKYKTFVMWTGSSFHVYLMLSKAVNHAFYDKYIKYSKDSPLESFTGRWAEIVRKKTNLNVIGGHEKSENIINIDPSQTPSGKLARAPFSLHMKDAKNVDGIAIPLLEKDLNDKNLVKKLKSYTPGKVLDELDKLAKNLP
jgi:hypothetical protein